jgi:hypothetical protein
MKSWMAGVFCTLMACAVWAESGAVRNTAEASMLVTGWIEVAPDGGVYNYSIDHSERIPPPVVDLIKKAVPGWKFHFLEPVSAVQRARMNVRIVAKPVDGEHDSIAISGANFGDGNATATDQVTFKDRQQPKYPREALDARVGGTVFLLMRVGRSGQIDDVAVEQVNLGAYGRESQMRHFRSVLGDAALEAAKKWTFNLPTTGKHVLDSHWDVRVPVNFDLRPAGLPMEETYGKWEPYIPGPRESVPWHQADAKRIPSDAIPTGSITSTDQSLQLSTALGGV